MKKIKAFLAFMLVAVTVFACSVPAFAASGLNANETEILNVIKTGVEINGKMYNPLDPYINASYNYMNKDGVDLTKAQTDEAIRIIKETFKFAEDSALQAMVKGQNRIDLNTLPYDVKKTILNNGIAAAAAVDLILTYEKDKNHVVIKDQSGKEVFRDEPIIKTTGETLNMTTTYVAVGIVGVLFVGAAVIVVMRKKLFA